MSLSKNLCQGILLKEVGNQKRARGFSRFRHSVDRLEMRIEHVGLFQAGGERSLVQAKAFLSARLLPSFCV